MISTIASFGFFRKSEEFLRGTGVGKGEITTVYNTTSYYRVSLYVSRYVFFSVRRGGVDVGLG